MALALPAPSSSPVLAPAEPRCCAFKPGRARGVSRLRSGVGTGGGGCCGAPCPAAAGRGPLPGRRRRGCRHSDPPRRDGGTGREGRRERGGGLRGADRGDPGAGPAAAAVAGVEGVGGGCGADRVGAGALRPAAARPASRRGLAGFRRRPPAPALRHRAQAEGGTARRRAGAVCAARTGHRARVSARRLGAGRCRREPRAAGVCRELCRLVRGVKRGFFRPVLAGSRSPASRHLWELGTRRVVSNPVFQTEPFCADSARESRTSSLRGAVKAALSFKPTQK